MPPTALVARAGFRVVDALLSGTHERGSSHHELLRAFADDETIDRMDQELNARGYLTHEFGDSVFVERQRAGCREIAASIWPATVLAHA